MDETTRYLIGVKLLHLREPSHTKAFWHLVDSAMPGSQEHARWLRLHGQELRDDDVTTALSES